MKILVILNYYFPYVSGLSEYARLLCEELSRRGNEVTVVTSNHDNLEKEQVINGVHVLRTPVWLKISKGTISPKFILYAIKYSKQADVVNLHLPMLESGLISLFIPKHKIICTYHCDINLSKGLLNKLILKIMDMSHTVALKRAENIAVNTIEYMEKSRVARSFIKKMHEISPPIKALPETGKMEHEKFRIGFCGRIVEEKGLDILIKAFEQLQKSKKDVVLVVGGDYSSVAGGSIYPKLKEYIDINDVKNVLFVGKIPEEKMAEFYSSLDVFVLPSVNSLESFGMVQVEAMLCGTPVIASDLYGVRTIVGKTGMGLICKKGNVEDLKECIIKVMDNPKDYHKMRSEIEEVYSTEITADKYIEIMGNMNERQERCQG